MIARHGQSAADGRYGVCVALSRHRSGTAELVVENTLGPQTRTPAAGSGSGLGGQLIEAFALQLYGDVSTEVVDGRYRMRLVFQMQENVAAPADEGTRQVVLTSAARRGARH